MLSIKDFTNNLKQKVIFKKNVTVVYAIVTDNEHSLYKSLNKMEYNIRLDQAERKILFMKLSRLCYFTIEKFQFNVPFQETVLSIFC